MSKSYNHQAKTSTVMTPNAKQKRGMIKSSTARWLTYALGFIGLYFFLAWTYGDVLWRAEQESYISTSTDTMHYLLSQSFGRLYWLFRWALLIFKWPVVGGMVLALIYTLTARLTDVAFCVSRKWEGLGFVVPVAQIGWMLYRGFNLYYKNEPSLFIVIAMAALIVMGLIALVTWLVGRKKKKAEEASSRDLWVRPYGMVVTLLLVIATSCTARYFNENVILTAQLQKMQWAQEWDDMVSLARSARQPSRSVVAYHAIALEETDQLLDGMYEIAYDFPKLKLDSIDGNEEYTLFTPDCNFHAGLLNASYRTCMDRVVMDGPRLFYFKRMAICALLNDEKALCRKYLALIDNMPFEGSFVEKYTAMLNNPKLIQDDPELAHVLSLKPQESCFEQQFTNPIFLGYNVGLLKGSDATLMTSIAACLYGKDIQNALPRIQVLIQKGRPLPKCVQEALCIAALKNPGMLEQIPQVGKFVPSEISSFLMDAKPYINDRLKLRHELRKQWLGSYVYYYYTENNDPEQIRTTTNEGNKSSVN